VSETTTQGADKGQALVPAEKAPVPWGDSGVQLTTMEAAYRWCVNLVRSGMVPRGIDSPEKALVALQTGMEAGLSPMAAIRAIYVVNGTPAWRGQDAVGLVRNSGKASGWSESFEGEGESLTASVRSSRNGQAYETRFSVADAKRAKLWGKSGPWTEYPHRMLLWRARGFHAKDYYSDVLLGLPLAEEAADYPTAPRSVTPAAPLLPPPPETPDPLLADAVEPETFEPEMGDEVEP
jgi:hypothetical protein